MDEWIRTAPYLPTFRTREEAAHLSDEQWAALERARANYKAAFADFIVTEDRLREQLRQRLHQEFQKVKQCGEEIRVLMKAATDQFNAQASLDDLVSQ